MMNRLLIWIRIKLGYREIYLKENKNQKDYILVFVKIKKSSDNRSYFTYKGRDYLIC